MPGGIKETGDPQDNRKGELEHKKPDQSNTSFKPSESTRELKSESTRELKKEDKDSPGSSTHHLEDPSKSSIFSPEGQKEDSSV